MAPSGRAASPPHRCVDRGLQDGRVPCGSAAWQHRNCGHLAPRLDASSSRRSGPLGEPSSRLKRAGPRRGTDCPMVGSRTKDPTPCPATSWLRHTLIGPWTLRRWAQYRTRTVPGRRQPLSRRSRRSRERAGHPHPRSQVRDPAGRPASDPRSPCDRRSRGRPRGRR